MIAPAFGIVPPAHRAICQWGMLFKYSPQMAFRILSRGIFLTPDINRSDCHRQRVSEVSMAHGICAEIVPVIPNVPRICCVYVGY